MQKTIPRVSLFIKLGLAKNFASVVQLSSATRRGEESLRNDRSAPAQRRDGESTPGPEEERVRNFRLEGL